FDTALGLRRPAAEALRLRAAALLLEAARSRLPGRLRRPALSLDLEPFAQLLDDPLDRELPVAPLAALVLGDGAQHRPGLGDHTPLLSVGERDGALDLEDRLGAGLRLLGVLPARPARAREAELDLRARDRDRTCYPNRLAAHASTLRVRFRRCKDAGDRRWSPARATEVVGVSAVLLDVDGVLHISGRPIDGAARAVQRLREDGNRVRFLTNNT